MTTFGARLRAAMDERGPLCAGIDPHPSLMQAWGLRDDIAGLERFALTAAEAFGPAAAAVKPQSAFFERFGAAGIAVLERTIALAREAGAQVVLDVKRGDIGSTARAYADAYLDQTSPLAVDAITVNPFLGFGSLAPMVETARAHDAGIFVLALTSNPEAPQVQAARSPDGRTVAAVILDELRAANADSSADSSADVRTLGSFGAVVGATIEQPAEDLSIDGPLLAPGIGAQGGDAASVRRIFAGVLPAVLASASRSLLCAGPDVDALRTAVRRQAAQIAAIVAS